MDYTERSLKKKLRQGSSTINEILGGCGGEEEAGEDEEERLEETSNRLSSGTPFSGSQSGMSEQCDSSDEDDCLPCLTPYTLRTTGDMKVELETIKAEQERTNAQLMGEVKVNDERLKTMEEKMSSLESKLNLIRAFVALIVLFLIHAYWNFLTQGFDDLVSKAGRDIETLMSNAGHVIETLKSNAAFFKDLVLSMFAYVFKIVVSMIASALNLKIVFE
jgi:hypothetical protein